MTRIAFLGLGTMGAGMAAQLATKGFDLSVWNRSRAKADALAEHGARAAATPAEAAAGADIVIAMVADDAASRAVWLGDDGALAVLRPGALAIESSTLTIDWVRTLAGAAQTQGLDFIDAPVTGSRQQASEGALKFLVGGADAVVARARPVLDAMGVDVLHLGPVGSGAILKLVNNFLCGVQVASVAEAVAMIERSGLDPVRAVAVLAGGAPGSPLVGAVSQRMLDRAYQPNFFPGLMAKDLAYAQAAFAAQGITLASADAARARFEAAVADGLGDKDIASIVEPLRRP